METQLKLDLKTKIVTSKKNHRLSIPCSEEFLSILDMEAERFGTTRAELAFQFVLEGMSRAMGEIFMTDLHGDKTLSQLLGK